MKTGNKHFISGASALCVCVCVWHFPPVFVRQPTIIYKNTFNNIYSGNNKKWNKSHHLHVLKWTAIFCSEHIFLLIFLFSLFIDSIVLLNYYYYFFFLVLLCQFLLRWWLPVAANWNSSWVNWRYLWHFWWLQWRLTVGNSWVFNTRMDDI